MSDEFAPEPRMHRVPPSTQQAQKLGGTAALVAVVATVLGAGAYSVHQHDLAKAAQDQNAAVIASLKTTNEQVEQLTAKLNELTAPKPMVEAPVKHSAAVKTSTVHRSKAVAQHRPDDPRWKRVQEQLAAQGKTLDEQGRIIDATRQDLTSAKTELGDSIARTHGELVVLQKKGERNYYEFNIDKSKQFSRVGPMGIKLRKSNEKHQYADLELMVDDRSLTKKHVNLYEPAMFYTSDSDQPVQVVINSVTKNHIRGYISESKYRPGQLSAMAQTNGAQDEKPRQKLSIPK
jgi:hypothetical protein